MAKSRHVYKDAYNRCLSLLRDHPALPSEPELGSILGVSRTTVRAILSRMETNGLIKWDKRVKRVLRAPRPGDYFPAEETNPASALVERTFMRRLMSPEMRPGTVLNELELAREVGVGTGSVREFLIRFSRFGLIEKRPNSSWVLKGFTRAFALELAEIREMFEFRSAVAFLALPAEHPAWSQLDAIEREHHEMLGNIAERYTGFSELDERFHRLIHSAAHNRFIDDFYDVIATVFHYHFQWNKTDQRRRNETALREHLAYIDALRGGTRGEVDKACRRHLRSARETLLASVPG